MATTPEGKVKAAVKLLLKRLGIWYCMPIGTGWGNAGVPDFVCCRPVVVTPDMVGQVMGQFLAIETKAPGKRLNTTHMQDTQIVAIHKAGGSAVVVDDVQQLLFLIPEDTHANQT